MPSVGRVLAAVSQAGVAVREMGGGRAADNNEAGCGSGGRAAREAVDVSWPGTGTIVLDEQRRRQGAEDGLRGQQLLSPPDGERRSLEYFRTHTDSSFGGSGG